jgi:hypothetical protein
MMRSFSGWRVILLAAPLLAIGMQAASAETKITCESPPAPGDLREIRCPLVASGNAQRFRFKANFSGGHDDTRASLKASLDDSPLACDPDSKTSLFGEEGDISLECGFSMTGNADRVHILTVTLLWSHTQYMDIELHLD